MKNNPDQHSFLPYEWEPNSRTEINRVFLDHLVDNQHQNSKLGELARSTLAAGTKPEDPAFPDWRDHIDPIPVYAHMCGMKIHNYIRRIWNKRHRYT